MRIRVSASSGAVRCEESVRPCFAHAVWEHTVFIEIWKWVTATKKKEEEKRTICIGQRAKPRGDEEQSGSAV